MQVINFNIRIYNVTAISEYVLLWPKPPAEMNVVMWPKPLTLMTIVNLSYISD